jgi:hypothetical protein
VKAKVKKADAVLETKRVVAISDLHCGSQVGLTPPHWQNNPKLRKIQTDLWTHYSTVLASLQPIDVLLVAGDVIDGKGIRSGGTELLYPDLDDQCEIATACILEAKPRAVVMVYGTPYHVSEGGHDFERGIARDLKKGGIPATIGGHEWVEVNGITFDLKHKVGSSQIPHGRMTALAREQLWNMIWAREKEYNPRADVLLRGHVHYFNYCGGANWIAMSLPSLQGPGTKFGVRQCSGTVDFGLVSFDVKGNGEFVWKSHLAEFQGHTSPRRF